jgi:hypothetical protein
MRCVPGALVPPPLLVPLLILAPLWCGLHASASAQSVAVEPPVQVSPLDAGGHFFGFGNTKADPSDSLHLITCGMRQRAVTNGWQGYLYTSHDGGRSWRAGLIDSSLAQDSSTAEVSEVSCALGGLGRTYMVAETWNPMFMRHHRSVGVFRLYHSTDGERTWSAPVAHEWLDHSRSVVDNTTGAYRGRLYVFGNRGDLPADVPVLLDTATALDSSVQRQVFARKPLLVSEDDGMSLRGPVLPPLDERYAFGYPSEAVVLASGIVLAVYGSMRKDPNPQARRQVIEVVASTDGGKTLDAPVAVSRPSEMPSYHATMAVAPDTGRAPNRVYVAWAQGGLRRSRVMLAWSDDNGRTWSTPLAVNDVPPAGRLARDRGADARAPSLAVTPAGIVGLSWVERRDTCWRFAASTTGGASFGPSVPLNACPRSRPHDTQYFGAHLLGVPWPSNDSTGAKVSKFGLTVRVDDWSIEGGMTATSDGVFHPTWSVAESDGALWTRRVTVGAPTPTPASIGGLREVTKRTALEIAGTNYDEGTGEVTADVVVVNTDTLSLAGPLVLRLSSFRSSFGSARLVNSDGGGHAAGALVDLTANLPERDGSRELPPGGRSTPHRLVFRVLGVTPARAPANPTLVSVTADMFGGR